MLAAAMAPRRSGDDVTRRSNDAFLQERLRRGWSRHQLAEWANELATRRGYAPTYDAEQVRRIERNGVVPDDPGPELFCALFGPSPNDPMPPDRLGLPAPPAVLRRYDAPEDKDDPMERRTALKGLAALLTTPVLDVAVEPLRRLADMSVPMAVDGSEGLIAQLGYGYSGEPPARLIPRLRDLMTFADAFSGLAPAPYASRLRSVAGWSSGLLANALFDTGDFAAADPTIRLALAYGQQTADARLVAYAYDRQGMMAWERHDYTAALESIEAGLREAPPITAIRIRLLGWRARIYARLDRRDEALAALRTLEREHASLPTADLSEGSFAVNPGAANSAASSILLLLGDLSGARAHTEAAVAYNSALVGKHARPSRLAAKRLDLATIALRQGQPDEALEYAGMALRNERMIQPSRRALGEFVTELLERHAALPEARQFHEEFRALSA
jgi:tetratricopeptide (TPR) repeat protein